MKKRGFEIVSTFANDNLNLPTRATKQAAGYDFEAAIDMIIPSIWENGINWGIKTLFEYAKANENHILKPTLVPTGIKSYMQEDEFLQLANRSGNPLKRFLLLANGVGVIDADYYNNADNEGHIMFQFINFGLTSVTIKKGERIGQGIFLPFLKADGDVSQNERTSGFGSTGV
ncbi:MAG: dUTP diphosphatase [Streptococcaceae bacterium]|jgi:dUTP pyrophosphatase|nr:dUTP diphosphatase [Streptococcaceae bacterium]